jgi:hypothetical protein
VSFDRSGLSESRGDCIVAVDGDKFNGRPRDDDFASETSVQFPHSHRLGPGRPLQNWMKQDNDGVCTIIKWGDTMQLCEPCRVVIEIER